MEKLKSRKLWVAVAVAAVTAFSQELGIDQELVEKLIQLAMVYIVGQGVVDAGGALKGKGK